MSWLTTSVIVGCLLGCSSSGGECDAGLVGTTSPNGGLSSGSAWGECCTAQGGFFVGYSSGDCLGTCGGRCVAKQTPSAQQFACGYLACNDGQACTITTPDGDGTTTYACGASACAGCSC